MSNSKGGRLRSGKIYKRAEGLTRNGISYSQPADPATKGFEAAILKFDECQGDEHTREIVVQPLESGS